MTTPSRDDLLKSIRRYADYREAAADADARDNGEACNRNALKAARVFEEISEHLAKLYDNQKESPRLTPETETLETAHAPGRACEKITIPTKSGKEPRKDWIKGVCPKCGNSVVHNARYIGGKGYLIYAECWESLGVNPTCDYEKVLG